MLGFLQTPAIQNLFPESCLQSSEFHRCLLRQKDVELGFCRLYQRASGALRHDERGHDERRAPWDAVVHGDCANIFSESLLPKLPHRSQQAFPLGCHLSTIFWYPEKALNSSKRHSKHIKRQAKHIIKLEQKQLCITI